jgi:hypothetical protein
MQSIGEMLRRLQAHEPALFARIERFYETHELRELTEQFEGIALYRRLLERT